ncbi:MAG: VWA domain-containing protein [Candidatus Micrarchaeota archaeon]|nr:VWA domain-containing protein [Candidatus Micrarchaeota archaeon]
MKRMFFLSLDSLVAITLLLAIVPAIAFFESASTNQVLLQKQLYVQSADLADVMSKLKLADVATEPVVSNAVAAGLIAESDLNRTFLEELVELWASGTAGNASLARNLTEGIFSGFVSGNLRWAVLLDGDEIFNSSGGTGYLVAAGRKIISGRTRNVSATGCIASAGLHSIKSKSAAAYSFFGGFEGEGNLTKVVKGIPDSSTVSLIHLELSAGNAFELSVNNHSCGIFNATPGNLSVDSWEITDANCTGAIAPGEDNYFYLNFSEAPLEKSYIGGGFIKVVYDTSELNPPSPNVFRHDFPGINGLINYYSSFYVPGNVTSMNLRLHLYNNYTTYVTIGNATVMNFSGTNESRWVNATDANLSALLNYSQTGSATIPIRIGVEANVTSGKVNGTADVVLITDISGSMDWQMNNSNTGTLVNNCSDPRLYSYTTKRISLAKCLDKNFVDQVLSLEGNRVALVAFNNSVAAYENLTSNATYLGGMINRYAAVGSTCIACAINKAYDLLAQQSTAGRKKYIVVMSDGVANQRATPTCSNLNGVSCVNSAAFAVGNLGNRIAAYNPASDDWEALETNFTSTFRATAALNSSFAFAVGDSGIILKWDGANWANVSSAFTNTLRGVAIFNSSLAFAVGDSGRILKWNGTTWANVSSGVSDNLRGVSFANASLALAVGDGGRILKWNGASWSADSSPTTKDYYGVDALNNALAFAVTTRSSSTAVVAKWNGTTWSSNYSASQSLRGVDVFNSSLAFAVSTSGRVYQWSGGSWSYTTPASDELDSVSVCNASRGWAAGQLNGQLLKWAGSAWSTAQYPQFSYAGESPTGVDCSDDDSCSLSTSIPVKNANYSACRAFNSIQNLTIDSIGFGPVSSCQLANTSLRSVADCGNGTYYSSDNATELAGVYRQIADKILVQSTITQVLNVTGNITTILYPDSYLEADYSPETQPPGYQEITVNLEAGPFQSCNASFLVPPKINVTEAMATSYSGVYWSDNVSIRNSLTAGEWKNLFWLGNYGNYTRLGDPFVIQFPPSNIAVNETNQIYIKTGYSPANSSQYCSQGNKLIYSARIKAAVPYSQVLPNCGGGVVRVFYDTNYDGVADSSVNVTVGSNSSPGFNPVPRDVWELQPGSNAVDDAFLRLLSLLRLVSGNSTARPGSEENPVNFALSDQLTPEITLTTGIPYLWGPVQVEVITWV